LFAVFLAKFSYCRLGLVLSGEASDIERGAMGGIAGFVLADPNPNNLSEGRSHRLACAYVDQRHDILPLTKTGEQEAKRTLVDWWWNKPQGRARNHLSSWAIDTARKSANS
jgi:hypothetical protein